MDRRPAQAEMEQLHSSEAQSADSKRMSAKRLSGVLRGFASRNVSPNNRGAESAPSWEMPVPRGAKSLFVTEGEASGQDQSLDELTTKMQARFRGDQVRKKISVSTIPDSGIVVAHIVGDSADLERLGFENIDTTHGPKDLTYLLVPLDKHSPHLAGGRQILRPQQSEGQGFRALLAEDRDNPMSSRGPVAYINGSFYNIDRRASQTHEDAAAISRNKIVGEAIPEHVSVPKKYREDFKSIKFPNHSILTTAPLLSEGNRRAQSSVRFDRQKADDPKYKSIDGKDIPDHLLHADHPYLRSAVNFPASAKPNWRTSISRMLVKGQHDGPYRLDKSARLLVASDQAEKIGWDGQGMTMVELAMVMARIGALNPNPGPSYNLDGGGSSAMDVLDEKGRELFNVAGRDNPPPRAADFLTMNQTFSMRQIRGDETLK